MKLGGLLLLVGCVVAVVAEETPEVQAGAAEKVCEPGQEVTKECGVCRCNAEGTEYNCVKECTESQKVLEVAPQNDERCTPGELFKRGCNECKCPDSGMKSQAACTVMSCPDE